MKYCPHCRQPLTSVTIEGFTRLFCPATDCGYVFFDNPVPVVAIIVEYGGEIILARNTAWPEGVFSILTGFLEKGETPEQTAIREVKEELGLTAAAPSFIGYYSFFEMNQLLLAFHVTADGTITLGEELAQYKIVPVDRLKPWPFGTGHAVRDWLASRTSRTPS